MNFHVLPQQFARQAPAAQDAAGACLAGYCSLYCPPSWSSYQSSEQKFHEESRSGIRISILFDHVDDAYFASLGPNELMIYKVMVFVTIADT